MAWPPKPLIPVRYSREPHAPQAGGRPQAAPAPAPQYDGVAILGIPRAMTLPPAVDAGDMVCRALERRRADLAARGIDF